MGKLSSAVVEQAAAWIGKKEADGSHKEIIDIYNAHKPLARGYAVRYTDAWCAASVSAAAIVCGLTSIIPTECSCSKMIELLKEIGAWVENDARIPSQGEIIFYDWKDSGMGDNMGTPDHVGYVEKVVNGIITVIEGNYKDAQKRREIPVNAKYIRGFGVPHYDEEPTITDPVATKTVIEVAKEVLTGKWGNGDKRKQIIEAAGYNYAEVQAEVNQLLKGTSQMAGRSIEAIAKEVIAGKWGNGANRKKKLEAAGYNYAEVQRRVNKLL